MATAVICEFNPFHNGHKYLLNQAKMLANQPIIAIMSGSFTQRGEVGVTDKFTRAASALENGADLVLELPAVYAVSGAELFAKCGVEIAKSFDCVEYLAFGCETDDIALLKKAADAHKNSGVQSLVAQKMGKGDYYPRAYESAVRDVCGEDCAEVLSAPNNILAVEYLRSLENSGVRPLPVKRVGVGHDSKISRGGYASASYIRSLLRKGERAEDYMPSGDFDITYPENLERTVMYKLRSMSAQDFARLPEVSEGLENRIFEAVRKNNSLEEIINAVKTKRYTHARIRRIICCALLGIDRQLQQTPVEYVRVLGFNDEGAALLKGCKLNVVTSPSAGMKLGGNTARLLEKDIFACDIAALAYKTAKKAGADYVTPIIKK